MKRPRINRRWLLVIAAVALLASCRTMSFYAQAARGQWEISRKARPIPVVLADAGTAEPVRAKLRLVEELRAFAGRELGLPANAQYDHYTDLGRPFVVWVVYAAPEFSVKARTWWYPLVGSLAYRGFFKESDATREADRLRGLGHDVFVGGVQAYSTLGWFRDPVLNTFMQRSDAELAELIFHELAHQRLYLKGDTDFNEAFATAFGIEGARRWLRAAGRLKELSEYERDSRLEREFIATALRTRARLAEVFAANQGLAPDKLRGLKTAEFGRLRAEAEALAARSGGRLRVERWFAKPLNNARLNTLATYYDLVPGFEALLAAEGGDLEKFCRRVAGMRSLSQDERRAALPAAPSGS